MNFDSRHLDVLRAVVETGSITAAARRLNVTQPAVTGSVQKLEAAVSKTLLERGAKGTRPTSAGRRLYSHALRVGAAMEDALAELAESKQSLAPLRIGASTTIASALLPRLLARFAQRAPLTGVRVQVGNTGEILDAVRSGTLPLGLVEGSRRASRLHLEPYLPDELFPVVAGSVRGADLDTPILWREDGSGSRAVVLKALRSLGRRPREGDLEFGSSEAIREAAVLGLGMAFLSRWTVRNELDAGRLRVVPLNVRIERGFSWAMPSRELGGTAAEFQRFANAERERL